MAEDKRLTQIADEENNALSDLEQTYAGMVNDTEAQYDKLIDNVNTWQETQTQLQKEQSAFDIEKIEQQKDQAHKDYIKEQSGAYLDWQKQSNQYGVEAEKMAAAGLQNTGYSESSQVRMYNAYQNRVATAREVYSRAVLNYDNAIKDAQLQNNAILAEIASTALQQQLELGLQSLQYKNSLLSELTTNKLQTKQLYQSKWATMLDQINTEKALDEEIRQFNATLEEQQRQHGIEMAYKNAALEEEKRQFDIQQAAKQAGVGVINKGASGASSSGGQYLLDTAKKFASGGSKSNSDIVIVNSPLTAKGAAEKVASGELIVTKQEGNRVWVASNPNYVKGQSTLDKYTWLK